MKLKKQIISFYSKIYFERPWVQSVAFFFTWLNNVATIKHFGQRKKSNEEMIESDFA